MKLKQSKLSTPDIELDNVELLESNHTEVAEQLLQIKNHLNELKQQIYSTLDAGLENSKIFMPNSDDWINYFNSLLEEETSQPSINEPEFNEFKEEHKERLKIEKKLFKERGVTFNDYKKLAFLVSKVPQIGGNGPLKLYANMHINSQFQIFNEKPSVFLECAYTLQEFNTDATPKENRRQNYINAGTAFAENIDANTITSPAQRLCNDAGALIGSINSSISQINRVEALMGSNQYEIAVGCISAINHCLQATVDTANNSSMIQVIPMETGVRKLRRKLSNMCQKFTDFWSNLGRNSQMRNRDNYNRFFQRYEEITAEHPYNGYSNIVTGG